MLNHWPVYFVYVTSVYSNIIEQKFGIFSLFEIISWKLFMIILQAGACKIRVRVYLKIHRQKCWNFSWQEHHILERFKFYRESGTRIGQIMGIWHVGSILSVEKYYGHSYAENKESYAFHLPKKIVLYILWSFNLEFMRS